MPAIAALRRRLGAVTRIIEAVCGWFLLYVVSGALLGFAIARPYTAEAGCVPFNSVWGVLDTNCQSWLGAAAWFVAVGMPRMIIVFPAIVLASVRAFITNGLAVRYLGNAIPFALITIPVALIATGSFLFWRSRSKPFGAALLAVLLTEIVYLGVSE